VITSQHSAHPGFILALLKGTLNTPPFPRSDCSSPIAATSAIDYPVMREPKYDTAMTTSLWLRTFAFSNGSTDKD
jgi:hypothetical protein